MMARAAAVLLAGILIAGSAGARADREPGCEVVATGYPGTPGGCRYTAGGPGTFDVQTISGFIISASSDGGKTWRTLTSQPGQHNDPLSGVVVRQGVLASKKGDIVVAAITIGSMDTTDGTLRYQDGRIHAGG